MSAHLEYAPDLYQFLTVTKGKDIFCDTLLKVEKMFASPRTVLITTFSLRTDRREVHVHLL